MAQWPVAAREDVPSPELAAALFALDELPMEHVPWWAAAWLADGMGNEATAEIAGLDGRDPRAVRDLLPDVLGELGVPVPGSSTAAAAVAFDHLARLCLTGLAGEYWVVQKVEEIVTGTGYLPGIATLPLASLCGLTDEWGTGWGRSRGELTSIVRGACRRQTARHDAE